MCRRPAAKQAVSGVSPVIMASWWLLSLSSRNAGSLSVRNRKVRKLLDLGEE